MEPLEKIRNRIDWLDEQIVCYLSERMKAALTVGKIKMSGELELCDESRERHIVERLEMLSRHPLLQANITPIYKEIMRESKKTQQFFASEHLNLAPIGIVGLGLMGGSICKALKLKQPLLEIAALHHDSEDLKAAVEEGWISRVYDTVEQLAQNVELIILASPISTIISLAEQIKKSALQNEKLLVIDIASVKQQIAKSFETFSCETIEYIATHPMAGKEVRGFAHSEPLLFVGSPWFITAHKKNSESALGKIEQLVQFLGAKPLKIDAQLHDSRVALLSHLPRILSKFYLQFVQQMDKESLPLAGPGFQSFTRLAFDNCQMHEEIASCNKEAISGYLHILVEQLQGELIP